MKRISFIVLSLLFILAACKTEKSVSAVTYTGGSEELYRYQWSLTELNGKEQKNTGAKLIFTPGASIKVAGNSGCNNLNGTMELADNHVLKFSPLAMTRMACPEPNIEQPFMEALKQTTHWSTSGKALTLYNGSTPVAKFTAIEGNPGSPSDLNGTWELEYISGPRIAFDGLYPEKKPSIIFDGSTEYKGNTSCNGMGGKFTANANTIKLNPPITTMMACPGEGEQTFLRTLDTVDAWVIDGGKLVLKSRGVDVMRFARK